jgi:hypothetical protein
MWILKFMFLSAMGVAQWQSTCLACIKALIVPEPQKQKQSWLWQCTPAIPALRLRQEDLKFEASSFYKGRSCLNKTKAGGL